MPSILRANNAAWIEDTKTKPADFASAGIEISELI